MTGCAGSGELFLRRSPIGHALTKRQHAETDYCGPEQLLGTSRTSGMVHEYTSSREAGSASSGQSLSRPVRIDRLAPTTKIQRNYMPTPQPITPVIIACIIVTAGLASDAQSPHWVTVTTNGSPTARHESAMVSVDGKSYLLGGRGIKPVEEFNAATKTWRKLGPTPLEIHHFQPVAFDNQIYVMTAMTGKYPKETPLDSIQIYDPKADTWRQGSAIPKHRRRGGAGTVVHKGKIYIVGGIIDGHTSGTVAWFDEFDPKTGAWRELPDAPRIRDHFPAIVAGGRLYCVGGRNTSYHTADSFAAFFGAVTAEVDVFDFANRKWTTLPEKLPVATAAGGLIEHAGKIYYIGGESALKPAHAETQALDLKTGKWQLLARLEQGRHGGGAVKIRGRIYVAAGSGNRGGGPELASTEVFPLSNK